ncbi:MAG: hypothetical protein MHMPM18_002103 [Marteilia pararefringens]
MKERQGGPESDDFGNIPAEFTDVDQINIDSDESQLLGDDHIHESNNDESTLHFEDSENISTQDTDWKQLYKNFDESQLLIDGNLLYFSTLISIPIIDPLL